MVDTNSGQIELAVAVDQANNQTNTQSNNQIESKNDGEHAVTLATAQQAVTSIGSEQTTQSDNQSNNQLSGDVDPSLKQSVAITDPEKVTNESAFPSIDKSIDQSVNQSISIDDELLIPIAELMRRPPYDSCEGGLSQSEAEIRLERDGLNEFAAAEPVPLWLAYFYQFANLLMILLVISSVVAYSLKEYVEATAIMVVVLLNTNLAVFTERKADNALAALAAMSNPIANVMRDGQVAQIESRRLAVGDVIQLHPGDVIPADCRIIESHSFDANEMILTGESVPVRKHVATTEAEIQKALTPPNMIFSGTNVQGGNALAMVVAIGGRTKLGEIARLVTETANKPKAAKVAAGDATVIEKEPNIFQRTWRKIFSRQPAQTDMQKSISKLGAGLSSIAVIVCILVLVIGIARNHQNPDHPNEEVWLGMLLVAVSLAVSAIPEGLPLAVTVSLSLGGQRLARCNALVRRIAAVENLGTVNVICTDKTGTLTTSIMTCVQLAVGPQSYSTLGDHIAPITDEEDEIKEAEIEQAPVVVVPTEDPRSKRSFIHNFIATRMKQSSRSVQEQREKPHTENPFAAQTVNDVKHSHDAAINSPYMRETLLVTRIATLCSNAKLIKDAKHNKATATGNPTEAAIVLLADKVGLHADEALKQNPRVLELPFSSSKKMMFTVHELNPTDHIAEILGKNAGLDAGRLYLTCGKGSCDMLVPYCNRYFAGHESVEAMNDNHRSTIINQMEEMASQALRVIAVVGKVTNEAPKVLSTIDEEKTGDDDDALWAQQQRNLVFLGLIGIADPARPGVADAIDIARSAGIRTVMITGDFLITAKAIARNIRLTSKTTDNNTPLNEQALDCSVLRPNNVYLPDSELDALIPNCVVFARAQPRDKLEILRSLQRQGLCCAMSGDGSNDVPAISQADVGIAMGSGTDVCKGASAIVLLDDKFPTIITAIREGRSIYANIQKFIVFLVATNFIQMLLILFCIIAGLPVPMSPLQILAINILTDGLPALALSAMPSESDVMRAQPRNRNDFVINGLLRWVCFFHALWLVVILPIVFVITLYWSTGSILQDDILGLVDNETMTGSGCRVYNAPGWNRVFDPECEAEGVRIGRTAVFLALALSENARPYTVRWQYHGWWYHLTSNWALLGASALSLGCLFIIMFVPAVMDVFGTDYLPWHVWVFVLGCALLTVILDEIVKYFLYQRGLVHVKDDIENGDEQ